MRANIERFGRLPQKPAETWQGGLVQMPRLVADAAGAPYRPYFAIWVALRAQKIHTGDIVHPDERNLALVVDALLDFACEGQFGGYRPGRIEVSDPALAEHLTGLLRGTNVQVECVPTLVGVDAVLAELEATVSGGRESIPGPLDGTGVTLDLLSAFAEAAAAFYRAAPWQHLSDVNVVEVQSPRPAAGLKCCTVLGTAGTTFGLAFYESAKALWDFCQAGAMADSNPLTGRTLWQLSYNSIEELPFADIAAWEEHRLAVAGPNAYPLFVQFSGEGPPRLAGAAELKFAEAVLLALAVTTESEIDGGRWQKQVATADGPRDVRLEIPDLLKPPSPEEWIQRGMMPDRRAHERMFADVDRLFRDRPPESVEEANELLQRQFVGKRIDQLVTEPQSAAEQAQEVCYQAFDTFGRRRVHFARQALALDADCAEAYLILAEQSGTREAELSYCQQALAAAERTLGAEAFERNLGHFWGLVETRPYMRARHFLAETLLKLDRTAEAVEHFQELLRLNPNDNQGIRYRLLPLLLQLGQEEAAGRLLKEFDEDSANWAYCQALLAYRLSGNSLSANRELQGAFAANPQVPEFLGEEGLLPQPDSYSEGSVEEALIIAEEQRPAWQATPGAVDWVTREFDNWQSQQEFHARARQPSGSKGRKRKGRRK